MLEAFRGMIILTVSQTKKSDSCFTIILSIARRLFWVRELNGLQRGVLEMLLWLSRTHESCESQLRRCAAYR